MPLIIKDTSHLGDKQKIGKKIASDIEYPVEEESTNSNNIIHSTNTNCSNKYNNNIIVSSSIKENESGVDPNSNISNNDVSDVLNIHAEKTKKKRTSKKIITSVERVVTKQDVINERLNKKKLNAWGRKAVEIDKNEFEKLCAIHCTSEEIAGFFKVSIPSLEKWCKSTYGMTFSEAFNIFSAKGKISIRRLQFQTAQNNARMQIWLGKQFLHQTDYREPVIADTSKVVELLQALKAEAIYYEGDNTINVSSNNHTSNNYDGDIAGYDDEEEDEKEED